MRKQRVYCTPQQKVAILRRHLAEEVPILGSVSRTGAPADGVLLPAEGVLRERNRGFPAKRTDQPLKRITSGWPTVHLELNASFPTSPFLGSWPNHLAERGISRSIFDQDACVSDRSCFLRLISMKTNIAIAPKQQDQRREWNSRDVGV